MSERLVFELQAIDRATAPLKQVQNELDRTTAAVRRNASSYDAAAVQTNKFAKGALQQAGYQVGDFAVQVANGTSAIQAFGQQGAQMLGIFGPIGAVAGAAVAIFSAVAVAFQRAGAGAKDATTALSDLAKAVDEYRTAAEASRQSTQDIIQEFGQLSPAIRETLILMREIALENVLDDLKAAVESFTNEYGDMLNMIDDAEYGADSLMFLRETLGLAREDAFLLRDAFNELNTAEGPDEVAQAAADLALELESVYGSAGKIPPVFRKMVQQLAEAAAAAARVANAMQPPDSRVDFIRNLASAAIDQAEAEQKAADKISRSAKKQDPLAALREQLALEEQLLGKTDAQRRVIQALGVDWKKYGDATVNGLVEQINKMDQFNKLAEQQQEIASTIKSAMSNAFMSMVDGTKSVKDAFRDMARSIIAKLYEVLVVQQIVNGVMGLVGRAFPSLAPMLSGARAMGGPVTGNRAYLVGERGPEIVVPSRNSQVIPNHQMGGGGVTVVQNINISTGVQQTVRNEIRSLMPQIAESAKAAVADAKRRGGSYGSAFA